MVKGSSMVRIRKPHAVDTDAMATLGRTHPGLPYFSLDKTLEAYLDNDPEALKRLPANARTRLAIRLRLAGASYQQIADKLGYKTSDSMRVTIRRKFRELITLDADLIEEVIAADLMRLEALQLVMWEKATRFGDGQAVDRVLKIMEQRRELLGITMKERGINQIDIRINGENPRTLVVGGGEEDFIARLQQLRGEEQPALSQGNGHVTDAEIVEEDMEEDDG